MTLTNHKKKILNNNRRFKIKILATIKLQNQIIQIIKPNRKLKLNKRQQKYNNKYQAVNLIMINKSNKLLLINKKLKILLKNRI